MLAVNQSSEEPHVVDAAIRAFEAGQRVVLDRVDLARLDLARLALMMARSLGLMALGGVLIGGAWFALMAGLAVWLQQQQYSLSASLVLVGGLSGVVGAVTFSIGVRGAEAPLVGEIEGARTR